MRTFLLFFTLSAGPALIAQIGPYPGGGYPGGNGGGLPWPGGKTRGTGEPSAAQVPARVTGRVAKVEDTAITVDADDGRVLICERTRRTKIYRNSQEISASDLQAGDRVTVDALEDASGRLQARSISVDEPKEQEAGVRSADGRAPGNAPAPQAPAADPQDPGPPVLKHGAPPRPAAADADDDPGETPAKSPAADPVIEKARTATEAFTNGLPNFLCKEFMARYQSDSRPVDWKALDIVSTEIVYDGGKESYRNVAINDRPANKGLEQIGGSWSTGEFGTMLRGLLAPWTAADFRFRNESIIRGVTAQKYDFTVERERSGWDVRTPAQSIKPAYQGSVWIDPSNGRVLRIEMQARSLPAGFPLDTVESAVDYDYTQIGEQRFLLPVHAENLSCQRGTSLCTKNVIDFRNYRKFNADSSVTFASQFR